MTLEEVSVEIFARQGFIVADCFREKSIGQILPMKLCLQGKFDCLIRVVGPATREMLIKQCELADELMGIESTIPDPTPFYYRVEAVD